MNAIILAAGRGSRMSPLTDNCPKPLLSVGSETLLSRLIRQFHQSGIEEFTIVTGYRREMIEAATKAISGPRIRCVYNERFDEDVNIYSTSLALKKNNANLIIEADLILTDSAVSKIVKECKRNDSSIWFTYGGFEKSMMGGILKSDRAGRIEDIKIVPSFEKKYAGYSKLLGIMKVGKNESARFASLIEKGLRSTLKQYYLQPWIQNLSSLPARAVDIGRKNGISFNTPQDYRKALEKMKIKESNTKKAKSALKISMVSVSKLRHIEGYSKKRVEWLRKKILKEGVWNRPIVIDSKFGLVMDGQHRFEVARALKLKKIPAVSFNYHDVEVWSLRPNHEVNVDLVIQKALEGDIYPYKTVKHRFPGVTTLECKIDLKKLMKGLK